MASLVALVSDLASIGRDRELDDLVRRLGGLGIDATPVAWDASPDLNMYDLVIVRSSWGYFRSLRRFLNWISEARQRGARLENNESLLRWGCHKRYLVELHEAGLATVPTTIVSSPQKVWVAAEPGQTILKPAVGAGAAGCSRVTPDDDLAPAWEAASAVWPEVVVQPYMPSIETVGEASLVVIEGKAIAQISKVPAVPGYLTQREHGGTATPSNIAPDLVAIASDVCDYLVATVSQELPLVARIDALFDEGRYLISEVEVIEPVLFSDLNPEINLRLANAIAARL